MRCIIEIIKNNREIILTGEIGALLHDIGKCYPDFIGKNSVENMPKDFKHANIDSFLNNGLLNLIKDKKFNLKIDSEETSIYSIIREHHNPKSEVIKLVQSCDKLDSADDKGIVRKKQPKDDTIISSPFGFPKEKIDLKCLQKRFEDLQNGLIGIFQNYVSGKVSIDCFRKSLINNLKTIFSYALGETRIPANDVTLWDHSHSTASLFKSILCAITLGENPLKNKSPNNANTLQWRILGFCWDGIGFIEKGKKIADILQRNSIIEEIKNELKNKFEVEIPIGNVIYEDNNGIHFTFPALNSDNSKELAKECVEIGLEIIRTKSDNELWPFFTLSRASRTLTTIAGELRFASQKRNIPKMTPTLFVEGKEKSIDKKEEISFDNYEMPIPQKGKDICPVCRLRTKPVKDERCDICEKRRKGRLTKWLNNRENIIWIDEVADKNNRIALLSINFNLDKWLDGTMIGTIFSQTFEDWKNSQKWQKIQDIQIEANKDSMYKVLEEILKNKESDKDKAAKLLDTFFEENIGLNKNSLDNHLSNIKERIGKEELTKESFAAYLFTQNPSPARLYRIWKETESFFDLIIKEIKDKVYPHKWKRIKFSLDCESLKSKIEDNIPLIIKLKGLNPENLLVLHTSDGEFYTIDSLDKFKFNKELGINAVKETLISEIYWIAEEDKPDNNLLNSRTVKAKSIETEGYYPFIEITKSPLLLRLIIPALDSIKIIELIMKLYNQRFEKVLGKLPINIGLLVSKRKFPLYVLLDAGERLFYSEKFGESEMMDVWWDINNLRNDKYYGFYPTKKLDNQRYILDDLAPLSKDKPRSLYPGYFDFDLLLGTQDRYSITYVGKRRVDKDYALFSSRPYYFYQISHMFDLWEILQNTLSNSQIHFIEETLMGKLREWQHIEDKNKRDVFRKFAEATVKDAFGSNWEKLRKETQDFILNSTFNNLLFDTIILFKHTIKEDSENG